MYIQVHRAFASMQLSAACGDVDEVVHGDLNSTLST